MKLDAIEQAVINCLSDFLKEKMNKEAVDEKINMRQQISSIERRIKDLNLQLEGLEQLGFNPALEQAKKELKKQIESLEKDREVVDMDLISRDVFIDKATSLLSSLYASALGADFFKSLDNNYTSYDETTGELKTIFDEFQLDPNDPTSKFTDEHREILHQLIREVRYTDGKIVTVIPGFNV